jgi:Holliday junction resolvase RusA-like endonuclease
MIDAGAMPSMTDPPFAVAPDVVIDLPVPPSVNRTRKINWAWKKKVDAWINVCNAYVLTAKTRKISPLKLTKIQRFELIITLSENHTRIDLDAGLKALIDYLRRIEVVENDSQKHMRRLTVDWGYAPFGCRITVKPLGPQSVNEVLRSAAETLERSAVT